MIVLAPNPQLQEFRGKMSFDETQLSSLPASVVWKHHVPYLLARSYKRMLEEPQSEPLSHLNTRVNLAERILHFAALVALADGITAGADRGRVKDWLAALHKPSFGKLGKLLCGCTAYLGEKSVKPIIPELVHLASAKGQSAFITIADIRSEAFHDPQPPRARLVRLNSAVEEPLREIQEHARFFSKYLLATAQRLAERAGTFQSSWCVHKGVEETSEPMQLISGAPINVGHVYLVNPRDEAAWPCPGLADSFVMLPWQPDLQNAFRIRPG